MLPYQLIEQERGNLEELLIDVDPILAEIERAVFKHILESRRGYDLGMVEDERRNAESEKRFYQGLEEELQKTYGEVPHGLMNRIRGVQVNTDYRRIESENKEKGPGYIFVLNHIPHSNSAHIANGKDDQYLIGKHISSEEIINNIRNKRSYEDGAIVVSPDGTILRAGAVLEGLRTGKKWPTTDDRTLAQAMHFYGDVGTRNINSKAASYAIPKAVIYTLSQTSGDVRRFENSMTTLSTKPEEIEIKPAYAHLKVANG